MALFGFSPACRNLLRLSVAATLIATGAQAQRPNKWTHQRQSRFAQWTVVNADVERRVDALKTATAALVERRRQTRQTDGEAARAALAAKVGSLSPAERQRGQELTASGAAQAKAGDCPAAIATFEQALAINPALARALNGIGECLRAQGKVAEAAAYLTRTENLPPLDKDIEAAQLNAMVGLQKLPPPPDELVGAPPVILRVPDAPREVWDMPDAPVMTIIPAGEFTMGSPPDELYANGTETQHRVTIGYPLAVGKYNVTRGEFAAFVAATDYDANEGTGCNADLGKGFERDPDADWRNPGFPQTDDDPVVCVNFYDATAYAAWLSQRTGHKYRLPTDAEWEYATRGGTTTMYYWGNEIGTGHANCDGCNADPHERRTTPGGTFPPNAFGLYDMSGNVWKWLADCWNNSYLGAPADGSAWLSGNCSLRSRRSGSWFNLTAPRAGDPREPGRLRAAGRFGSMPHLRYSSFGFRVVREL
jgi:formylglycine-generating enzyme required for sulfatase activity